METDAHLTAFRAAADVAQDELLAVLRRHADALGGPLGQALTLIALTGSVCATVIAEAPPAAPKIYEALKQLAVYVAPSALTPQ